MESINRFPDLDREHPTVISAGSRGEARSPSLGRCNLWQEENEVWLGLDWQVAG